MASLFHLMLSSFIILTLQHMLTPCAGTPTTTVPTTTVSSSKNETEARCQKWLKNGSDPVNTEVATTCLEHYAAKLSENNIPNCKYEIANIFCKKSPLAATITSELQAWTIARVHLVLATSRLTSKIAGDAAFNLTEARRLAADAHRLIEYHSSTQIVICRPTDLDCQRCVTHNLNCIHTKFSRRDICTSEVFYRVIGHEPRLIEEDCKVMLLE